jgi:hypothetical protein
MAVCVRTVPVHHPHDGHSHATSNVDNRPKNPSSAHAKDKIEKTMHEFKTGGLHSGSKQGPKVTNRKQAIAIALSQARKEG